MQYLAARTPRKILYLVSSDPKKEVDSMPRIGILLPGVRI